MLFFYIRHGDPIYDPDSLTELGRQQAKALAKRLGKNDIDRIYSSSNVRAMQTAQPTCDMLKKELIPCDWAREQNASKYFMVMNENGRRTWCFKNNITYPLFLNPEVRALGMEWYKHPSFAEYNFEEGILEIDKSVDRFFLELGYRHDRKNARFEIINPQLERVALFAHQGFGMCFFSSLLDIPYSTFSTHFDFGHSSMTVINFEQYGDYVYPRVLQLSNDSHLYREDVLTGYQNEIEF